MEREGTEKRRILFLPVSHFPLGILRNTTRREGRKLKRNLFFFRLPEEGTGENKNTEYMTMDRMEGRRMEREKGRNTTVPMSSNCNGNTNMET